MNQKQDIQAQYDAKLRRALYNYLVQQVELKSPPKLTDRQIKQELARVFNNNVNTIASWLASGTMVLIFLVVAIVTLSMVVRLALLILGVS